MNQCVSCLHCGWQFYIQRNNLVWFVCQWPTCDSRRELESRWKYSKGEKHSTKIEIKPRHFKATWKRTNYSKRFEGEMVIFRRQFDCESPSILSVLNDTHFWRLFVNSDLSCFDAAAILWWMWQGEFFMLCGLSVYELRPTSEAPINILLIAFKFALNHYTRGKFGSLFLNWS